MSSFWSTKMVYTRKIVRILIGALIWDTKTVNCDLWWQFWWEFTFWLIVPPPASSLYTVSVTWLEVFSKLLPSSAQALTYVFQIQISLLCHGMLPFYHHLLKSNYVSDYRIQNSLGKSTNGITLTLALLETLVKKCG